MKLKLGTRGSDLALTQAKMTQQALAEQQIDCEICVIKTIGDKRPDLKLSEFSEQADGVHDKGIFTKELEEALLAGEIDFAVHSLKDVPTELAEPFAICTTLPRAPIEDVILTTQPEIAENLLNRTGYGLDRTGYGPGIEHPLIGKTVATSSVRRAAQLNWCFPGVLTDDIRGNVPTRIRKLIENPDWHAIVLARAGIQRLGIYKPGQSVIDFEGASVYTLELPPAIFPPAASQGAVAMEVLKANQPAIDALAKINHEPTFAQITAERSFLAALKAGCQTPVGIHTQLAIDGQTMVIDTVVFSEADLSAPPKLGQIEIDSQDAGSAGLKLLEALK